MLLNTAKVIIFLFIIIFGYFIISTYVSEKNIIKIKQNRNNFNEKISNKVSDLIILENDTENVIEFNSGYNNFENDIKRNFWDLLKKND